MSKTQRWWAIVAVVVLAAAVTVGLVVSHRSRNGTPVPEGVHDVTIPMTDDVQVSAEVYEPDTSRSVPLVVMPVPFGSNATVYRPVATALSARGYVVLTYVQRGFDASQGQVDFAGPATQADASTVITWALAHTSADPAHVGMMGMSYGAGISLLTAAHDKRVRAVAALSTWTDFARSFDPYGTPSTLAISALVGRARNRLAPSVTPMAESVRDPSTFPEQLSRIAPARSPQTYLAQLNANRPAVMIANAFEDSFFPPQQLVDFFDKLTTPKRLQLAPGDHGGPEYTALQGEDNRTVDDAYAWLDRYLKGTSDGTDSADPIQLTDITDATVHGFPRWPSDGRSIALNQPNSAQDVGVAETWTASLPSATDSGADSGVIKTGPAVDYHPPLADARLWDQSALLEWSGAPVGSARFVCGTPQVHVQVASTTSSATFVAYLYETDDSGAGALMSVQPYTATGLTPGTPSSVTFDLQPLAWTIRPDDHVVLVIDTADPRFGSPTPSGATITFSSTAADPATVSIPISGG